MTPLLIALLGVLGVALTGGALGLARWRRRRRVQTLVWDPASGRWREVRGRAVMR